MDYLLQEGSRALPAGFDGRTLKALTESHDLEHALKSLQYRRGSAVAVHRCGRR
jgi:hypothetical protein